MISISDYHNIEQIHEGRKSIVFRGVSDLDDRPVILKIRKKVGGVSSPEHPLTHEFEILQRITSEFVPKVYDLKTNAEQLVLVCEDISGEPLSSFDPKFPTSLHDRLEVAYKLAAALHEVHLTQVVHRDINPSNVIWNPETEQLQVIDFGLALTQQQLANQPILDSVFQGTLAYMAPEQTGRVNKKVDSRTDLYSLGATLYELFTHKPPFLSDNELELIHAHIAKLPKAPVDIDSFVPDIVSKIIVKLLSKSAEDRYQTAYGVSHDLLTCLQRLDQSGTCTPFELAQRDKPHQIIFSNKFYGRQTELQRLKDVYGRVSNGSTELVLVSGYAGVGKTALVELFSQHVRKQ